MTDTERDPILKAGESEAGREAMHDRAEVQAFAVLDAIHGLLTGRKVIAVQHVERPAEERENPGLGQWDSYVRVLDADDDDDASDDDEPAVRV